MTFHLSQRSIERLQPAHPHLSMLVHRAIEVTTVDFTVLEVLRSKERQQRLVETGASHTMYSRHLMHPDGLCYAVDLGALIDNELDMSLGSYYPIARAMQQASNESHVPLRWGGAWARLDGHYRDPTILVTDYVAWRRAEGNKPFIDAFHFELPKREYPGI